MCRDSCDVSPSPQAPDGRLSSGASQFQFRNCSTTSGGFKADTQALTSSDGRSPTTSNVIFDRAGPVPKKFSDSSLLKPLRIAFQSESSPPSNSSSATILSKFKRRISLISPKWSSSRYTKNSQSPYDHRIPARVDVHPYFGSTVAL